MTPTLLRNANIKGQISAPNNKGQSGLNITINDEIEHYFSPESKIGKELGYLSAQKIIDRLNNGNFFIIGDKMVDYRDNRYSGFIHTDNSIENLYKTLGLTKIEKKSSIFNRFRQHNNSGFEIGGAWTKSEIEVKALKEGGNFTSNLRFGWNPFSPNVSTKLEIERLICTNGMVAMTPLLNYKLPVINNWEEHIEIAAKQIGNKVDSLINHRVEEMAHTRATVQELMAVEAFAANRMTNPEISKEERDRLKNIRFAANPKIHLDKIYSSKVFENRNLAAHSDAHLTQFDAWNMLTEMDSYTKETQGATSLSVQRAANVLLFDSQRHDSHGKTFKASENLGDHTSAFFGEVA